MGFNSSAHGGYKFFIFVTEFELDQTNLSSTFKEIMALKQFLIKKCNFLIRKKFNLVYWQCDNQSSCTGSRKTVLQELIFEIEKLEVKFSVTIVPVWTPRSHPRIVTADIGSKLMIDSNQWSKGQK